MEICDLKTSVAWLRARLQRNARVPGSVSFHLMFLL
ncbi:hypothetical protein LEMLEM_LOCUS3957 [Lemmus lemmus]